MPHLLSDLAQSSISQVFFLEPTVITPYLIPRIETLEELLPHPLHLQEDTLPWAIYTWYTDSSSFLHEGTQKAGYAIVSDTEMVEAQALPTPIPLTRRLN